MATSLPNTTMLHINSSVILSSPPVIPPSRQQAKAQDEHYGSIDIVQKEKQKIEDLETAKQRCLEKKKNAWVKKAAGYSLLCAVPCGLVLSFSGLLGTASHFAFPASLFPALIGYLLLKDYQFTTKHTEDEHYRLTAEIENRTGKLKELQNVEKMARSVAPEAPEDSRKTDILDVDDEFVDRGGTKLKKHGLMTSLKMLFGRISSTVRF